jgi:hypothetical protein
MALPQKKTGHPNQCVWRRRAIYSGIGFGQILRFLYAPRRILCVFFAPQRLPLTHRKSIADCYYIVNV